MSKLNIGQLAENLSKGVRERNIFQLSLSAISDQLSYANVCLIILEKRTGNIKFYEAVSKENNQFTKDQQHKICRKAFTRTQANYAQDMHIFYSEDLNDDLDDETLANMRGDFISFSLNELHADKVAFLNISHAKNDADLPDNHDIETALRLLMQFTGLWSSMFDLWDERDAAYSILDKAFPSTFVLDRDERLIYRNRKAEDLVFDNSLMTIDSNNRLRSKNNGLNKWLSHLGNDSHDRLDQVFRVTTEEGKEYCLMHLPVSLSPTGSSYRRQHYVIMVSEIGSAAYINTEELEILFGLTPTEASILGDISSGSTVQNIAHLRAISIHTVRSIIKSVLRKLGVGRQQDAIKIVYSMPMVFFDVGYMGETINSSL